MRFYAKMKNVDLIRIFQFYLEIFIKHFLNIFPFQLWNDVIVYFGKKDDTETNAHVQYIFHQAEMKGTKSQDILLLLFLLLL